MERIAKRNERTRRLLAEHFRAYPELQTEDIFKFLFQSAFGCEHMVSDERSALSYILAEYSDTSRDRVTRIDRLDGEYSRVHLSCLGDGLEPSTLARLFCLSSKNEEMGREELLEKIDVAREMILEKELPIDMDEFDRKLDAWRKDDYPAIHHSETFRRVYRPAYRVVSNRFADLLQVYTGIDKCLKNGPAIVAIEGGSASGKSTLGDMLRTIYDCNLFHMDDFFLRPEQHTKERLAEIGGNVDRERFLEEILAPARKMRDVTFRRFDCTVQSLEPPVTLPSKRLTIVEGAYSMHPELAPYYDLSVCLDIDPECQQQRIRKRNSPMLAKRFFEEWIPLENLYFDQTRIKERCSMTVKVGNGEDR